MKVAYDMQLMRPACVNLAAAMGASTDAPKRFLSQYWVTAPTPDMKIYDTNEHQLLALIKLTREHRLGQIN